MRGGAVADGTAAGAEASRAPERAVTPRQRIAMAFTCKLPEETSHPRFRRVIGRWSTILTLNSGFE